MFFGRHGQVWLAGRSVVKFVSVNKLAFLVSVAVLWKYIERAVGQKPATIGDDRVLAGSVKLFQYVSPAFVAGHIVKFESLFSTYNVNAAVGIGSGDGGANKCQNESGFAKKHGESPFQDLLQSAIPTSG